MSAQRSAVSAAPIRQKPRAGTTRALGRPARHGLRRVAVALVAFLGFSAWGSHAVSADSGDARGSGVLPPAATPEGYSRADMARLLGQFTTSGNDSTYYPRTPFQVLYVDPARAEPPINVTSSFAPCSSPTPPCGLLFTQSGKFSNSFKVDRGTRFFVPVDNADDSPPIAGQFPTDPKQAKDYVTERGQLGAKGMSITIDSHRVELGASYIAGPVTTPPLLDGGGTHIITIGAFLAPMSPGEHVVRIRGGYFGRAIEDTYGIGFIALDFTYRVVVAAA